MIPPPIPFKEPIIPFAESATSETSPNMLFNALTISTALPALTNPNIVSKLIEPITEAMLSITGDKNSDIFSNPPAIALKKLEKSRSAKYPSILPTIFLRFNTTLATLLNTLPNEVEILSKKPTLVAVSLSPLKNLPIFDAASSILDPIPLKISLIGDIPLIRLTTPSFTITTVSKKPLKTAPILPAV